MAAFEKMINFNAKVEMSYIKIIADLVFEINSNGRNIKINLIKVLLQLGAVGSEIWSLEIIVFFLVFHLVDIVTKEQCR